MTTPLWSCQGELAAIDSIGAAGEPVVRACQMVWLLADDVVQQLLDAQSTGNHTAALPADAAVQQLPNAQSARNRISALPADAVTIAGLANELGFTYAKVYQWTQSGRITARRHRSGELIVDPDDAQRERDALTKDAALRARSMTVSQAAERIECGHSAIYFWLRRGDLQRDEETDSNGFTYVTRQSVEAKAATEAARLTERKRRRPVPSNLVPLAEVQRCTGNTRHQIAELVEAGVLTQVNHDRRFHIERASLDAHLSRRGLPPRTP